MKKDNVENRRNRSPIALAVAAALGTGAGLYPSFAGAAEDPLKLIDFVEDSIDVEHTALAVDADGDAIFVWAGSYTDPDGDPGTPDEINGIFFHRIGADGGVSESTSLVEGDFTLQINHIAVAMDADGDAIVAWNEFNVTGAAKLQRIAADGSLQGSAITVVDDAVSDVTVGMDAVGNSVVAWSYANNLHFRQYTATGEALPDPAGPANQLVGAIKPRVGMGPGGQFVIVWSRAPSPFGSELLARPFSSDGNPVHDEIVLDSMDGPGAVTNPYIAVDADGDFAVGWVHYDKYTGPGPATPPPKYSEDILKAQRFNADGTEKAPATDLYETGLIEIATTVISPSINGIAFDISGDVIIGWNEYEIGTDDLNASLVKRLKADDTVESIDTGFDPGECAGGVVGECREPIALVLDADGDRTVAFMAYDNAEDKRTSVHVQRFQGPEKPDLAATFAASATEVHPGDDLTVTLTIENLHPLDPYYGVSALAGAIGATRGVQVDLTFPEGLELGDEPEGWTCTDPVDGMTTCSHTDALWAAGEFVLETTFQVPADANGEYTMSASVTSADTDSDPANNADEISVTVSAAPAGDDGNDDDNTPPPASGGGGGALGWLALLLAPFGLRARRRRQAD